ncbi:hypothetical protein KUCAC02_024547, partial [Chaenocephalus aceratus]
GRFTGMSVGGWVIDIDGPVALEQHGAVSMRRCRMIEQSGVESTLELYIHSVLSSCENGLRFPPSMQANAFQRHINGICCYDGARLAVARNGRTVSMETTRRAKSSCRRLCVSREANSDLFEQIMRPSTSKRTKGSFLVRKRVCNTICGLNGAGQRVRGSSCITTATILQETTLVELSQRLLLHHHHHPLFLHVKLGRLVYTLIFKAALFSVKCCVATSNALPDRAFLGFQRGGRIIGGRPQRIWQMKAVQMFLRAGLRFPCFPFAGLFPDLQCCQGAALLGAGVFVFPESGALTGGSSPGQLQMRNSWPAALAATQIRPFEKITVLLLPPPP